MKILGIFLIALPFIALFFAVWYLLQDLQEALAVYFGAIFITGLVVLSVYLGLLLLN